jgi:hypothetical protein
MAHRNDRLRALWQGGVVAVAAALGLAAAPPASGQTYGGDCSGKTGPCQSSSPVDAFANDVAHLFDTGDRARVRLQVRDYVYHRRCSDALEMARLARDAELIRETEQACAAPPRPAAPAGAPHGSSKRQP